jgi:pyruvate,orthophosphate dikinase
MIHADPYRRLGVHANADTGADAARARRFGATGIGLCRTEHMFLGDRRRELVERLILAAPTTTERDAALAALLPLQRPTSSRSVRGDGRPAGHRAADRPAAARVPAAAGGPGARRSPGPRRAARTPAATASC